MRMRAVRTTGARSDTDLACYLMYFRWHMIRLNDLIIVHYLKYMISNIDYNYYYYAHFNPMIIHHLNYYDKVNRTITSSERA